MRRATAAHQDAATTMPAPTVSFVDSSIRMNAPVARLRAYGSTASGSASRKRTTPRSFSSSCSGAATSSSVCDVDDRDELVDDARGTVRVVCLTSERARGLERPLAHPADARRQLARDDRRLRSGRRAGRRARRRRRPRAGSSPTARAAPRRPARGVDGGDAASAGPDGSTTTSSPARQTPPATWPA